MVTVVTGVFEIFATGGLSAATVQRPEISNKQIRPCSGSTSPSARCSRCFASRPLPLLSAFYNDSRTALILIALAPAFIVNATGVQHLALLQRELRYATLAAIEVGSEIVSAAIAIGMAVAGFGYWSIVASVIACPFAITIGAWTASGWIPGRPPRDRARRLDAALWRHDHAQQPDRLCRLQLREGSPRTLFRLRRARALQQGL